MSTLYLNTTFRLVSYTTREDVVSVRKDGGRWEGTITFSVQSPTLLTSQCTKTWASTMWELLILDEIQSGM